MKIFGLLLMVIATGMMFGGIWWVRGLMLPGTPLWAGVVSTTMIAVAGGLLSTGLDVLRGK